MAWEELVDKKVQELGEDRSMDKKAVVGDNKKVRLLV